MRNLFAWLSLIFCLLFVLGSLGSIFLQDSDPFLAIQLFLIACIFFAILLTLRFKELVNWAKISWWWFGPRQVFHLLLSLLFLIIFSLLSLKYENSLDTTEEGRFTMSKESLTFLQEKEFSLLVVANAKSSPKFFHFMKRIERVLDSLNCRFIWIDPDKEPDRTKKEGALSIPCVIVKTKNKKLSIPIDKIILTTPDGNERYLFEFSLVQTLIQIENETELLIHYPSGEQYSQSQAPLATAVFADEGPGGFFRMQSLLKMDGFSVRFDEITTSNSPFIVFVTKQIKTEPLKERIEKNLPTLLLFDPYHSPDLPFFPKTAPIVDLIQKMGEEPFFITPEPQKHPVTKILREAKIAPILASTSAFNAQNLIPLLSSSKLSWAEQESAILHFDEGVDLPGPLAVAVQMENKKILAVGDQDFCTNQFLFMSGNRRFLLNSLHWLAGHENLLENRGKEIKNRKLEIPIGEKRFFIVISMIILPAFLLFVSLFFFAKTISPKSTHKN